MDNNKVDFKYGMTKKSLQEQAKEKGFTFGNKGDIADAINSSLILIFSLEMITEKEFKKLCMKLHKTIMPWLKPYRR